MRLFNCKCSRCHQTPTLLWASHRFVISNVHLCVLETSAENFYVQRGRFIDIFTRISGTIGAVPPRYSTNRRTFRQISKGSLWQKENPSCDDLFCLFFFPVSSSNACAEQRSAVAAFLSIVFAVAVLHTVAVVRPAHWLHSWPKCQRGKLAILT